MIKQIIFDLDGVIIDSRELHWKSFSMALEQCCPKYTISEEEHIAKYDGLPTRKKLQILTEEKGLPIEMYGKIFEKKTKVDNAHNARRIQKMPKTTHHPR